MNFLIIKYLRSGLTKEVCVDKYTVVQVLKMYEVYVDAGYSIKAK